jgi:RHS repeat-associated protein
VALYATRVEDRFGNWVEYSYNHTPTQPMRLNQITSSDNRTITLGYNSNGLVSTVTENNRTWNYSYSTLPGRKSLTGLSRTDSLNPGDSWVWTFNLMQLSSTDLAYSVDDGPSQCNSFQGVHGLNVVGVPGLTDTATGWITHPSGAVGKFEVTQGLVSRNNVPNTCLEVTHPDSGAVVERYPDHISRSWALKLKKKEITGPGMAMMDWSYSNGSGGGTRITGSCLSSTCAGTGAISIVTGPLYAENTGYNKREWTRYTFGNSYGYNEGKLLKTEKGYVPAAGGSAEVMESSLTAYMLPTASPPTTTAIGTSLRTRGDGFTSEHPRPRNSHAIERFDNVGSSATFSWSGTGFTAANFYRPTNTTHSSTLGFTRTEALQYHDNLQLWVLGQLKKRTVTANGQVTVPEEITTFNLNAQPTHFHRFGRLDEIRAYHVEGQLKEINDGLNPQGQNQITMLTSYKRGIPQQVSYADSSSESAVVNDRGEISSHTDPSGATTSYQYDALGLVKLITYPIGDSTTWFPTTISFQKSTSAAFGLPAGHWRREVKTGNSSAGHHRAITYYNALWQPVLVDEHETNGSGTTPLTTTQRMVNRTYDPSGRQIKLSFPVRSIANYNQSLDGQYSYFDAIGRITRQGQDSELTARANPLTKAYTYLSDFRTQVADEYGRPQVIYSYQAYDQPTTDWPVLIQAAGSVAPPNGINTTISRDVYGKPLNVSRSNPAGSGYPASTVARSFYYDAHQRLCKRVEPESGATYFAYDIGTNNLDWQGHTSNATSTCNASQVLSADRIDFSYDLRNRLTATTYLDGSTIGSTRTWTPDGLPLTVSQGGSVWTYGYNKRRMLTSETLSLGGQSYPLTYGYSGFGTRSQMSYPDATVVQYQPNRFGEPTQVQIPGQTTYASGITHHPNGALAFLSYGNGLNYNVDLNERMLPERVTMDGVYDDIYQWDPLGNLDSIDDLAGLAPQSRDRSMDYDNANRLTEVNSTALGQFLYQYDNLDNLRQLTRNGTSYTYKYDDGPGGSHRLQKLHLLNQPTTEALGYTHDSRGNVTQRRPVAFGRPSHDFIVDKAHRATELRTIGSGSALESYLYDGNGKRVQITDGSSTRVQIYNAAGQFVYETSTSIAGSGSNCSTGNPVHLIICSGFEPQGSGGSPSSTRHIHLAGKQIARTKDAITTFVHTDLLGSVVAESTPAPVNVTHRDLHEPYGAPSNGIYIQGPDYTGHVTDAASGLSYMEARYYDPLAGRFLGTDPVHVDLNSGGNFNRYWYANNNPYRFVDPDGRDARTRFGTRIRTGDSSAIGRVADFAREVTNQARRMSVEGSVGVDLPTSLVGKALDSAGLLSDDDQLKALLDLGMELSFTVNPVWHPEGFDAGVSLDARVGGGIGPILAGEPGTSTLGSFSAALRGYGSVGLIKNSFLDQPSHRYEVVGQLGLIGGALPISERGVPLGFSLQGGYGAGVGVFYVKPIFSGSLSALIDD